MTFIFATGARAAISDQALRFGCMQATLWLLLARAGAASESAVLAQRGLKLAAQGLHAEAAQALERRAINSEYRTSLI